MNCRHADILIQQSLDNALPARSVAALDAHLAVCARCQKAREEYRHLAGAATAWLRELAATYDPGNSFAATVMARLDARSMTVPLWPRLAAAGIAFAVLLALSMTLGASISLPPNLAPPLPHPGGVALFFNWLASQMGQLSRTSLDTLETFAGSATASRGVWAAFAAALCVNAALFLRATHHNRRRTA